MPIIVKIAYQDEFAVVEDAVRAEEKAGFLLVYAQDGSVLARFGLSEVKHWWIGNTKKTDAF
jgi:hypothetical protein